MDGDWADSDEQIHKNFPTTSGSNYFAFLVPSTAKEGATFARFRFSTVDPRSHSGLAIDGEVEDYAIEIRPTFVDREKDTIPVRFELQQNYPNPFNPVTKICYSLPRAEQVRLTVFNLSGQKVAALVDEARPAGFHQVIWDGRDAAGRISSSGIYLYRIEAGEFNAVKKLLFLK